MVKLSTEQSGSIHSQGSGFRLQDTDRESGTSISGYSIYKQRIDSMFDETRSQMSGYCGAPNPVPEPDVINNTVQARIEKMFAEVSKTAEVKHLGCRFAVKHLGCVPLKDRVTSLHGLQEPLRELYLMRRATASGTIEISREGLRVREDLKPFHSIAVWAAVQFVLRRNADGVVEYAFLPLIADPEALDKGSLFKELTSTKDTILETRQGMRNPPLFAVVMRKPGSNRSLLECHGFVCNGSEDAIVIAANLYQALMTNLQKRPKPQNRHGVSYVSIGGSSRCGSNLGSGEQQSDPVKVAPKVPMRPPRQKKKSISSSDGEEIVVDVKPTPEVTSPVRRTASESDAVARGDILTKIAIPRSQSFLNPGGALMRYAQRPNEAHNQGSPLGFRELFTEFRVQEGLHSLDDILDVIIDADGMSFNDLKPIYKEFLMKLAVTLTKDELYQRSKNIMRRQKKKHERKRKSRIKKVFNRSVSKLRSSQSNSNFEFTSVLFPTGSLKKKKLGYVTASSSSYGTRRRNSRRQSTRRRRLPTAMSTSEDSDFFSMAREKGPREQRASSGYISCSECSFDSELCSCKDKCYCSKAKAKAAINCQCDTDSCIESDKCYCKKANVFEQLKRRGFAASESSNSRTESPAPKYGKPTGQTKKHSSVKSTKSLEFLQIKPKWESGHESVYQKRMDVYDSLPVFQNVFQNVIQNHRRSHSSEQLGLDYDLFSKCRERKVLVVSARDTRGRIIYNKTTDSHKSNDALSVKKSAEIAALFHEVKFSHNHQEQEMSYNQPERAEYFTMRQRNVKNDLEMSLGYFP